MALAVELANDKIMYHEICKRCVGGLNQINAFVSDSDINALSGASAHTDLITLITTTKAAPSVRHHDDYQISLQVADALQAAIDAEIISASDVAGCATRQALRQLFVTADPLQLVTLTTTCGDAWIA